MEYKAYVGYQECLLRGEVVRMNIPGDDGNVEAEGKEKDDSKGKGKGNSKGKKGNDDEGEESEEYFPEESWGF